MKILQVPAQITAIGTLKDRTIKVGLSSLSEWPDEEITKLLGFRGSAGWFMFAESDTDFDNIDIPDEAIGDAPKTPSQRLRGVLYVWWEQQGKKGTFDEFYKAKMEHLISQVKEKLDAS